MASLCLNLAYKSQKENKAVFFMPSDIFNVICKTPFMGLSTMLASPQLRPARIEGIVHQLGSKQSLISATCWTNRLEPCSIPSKKLSTRSMSWPTKTPTSPLTLLLRAAIIWPKKPSIPLLDSCSVRRATTPFWKEEIKAQGEMDKWDSRVIAIPLIGYGNEGHGYLVTAGFYKFIVVSIESFFVFTCRLIDTAGKTNFDIKTCLLASVSFYSRLISDSMPFFSWMRARTSRAVAQTSLPKSSSMLSMTGLTSTSTSKALPRWIWTANEVDSTTGKYTRQRVWLSIWMESRARSIWLASRILFIFSEMLAEKSHRWYTGVKELFIIPIRIGSYTSAVSFYVLRSTLWYSRIYIFLVKLFCATVIQPSWENFLNLISQFSQEFSVLISNREQTTFSIPSSGILPTRMGMTPCFRTGSSQLQSTLSPSFSTKLPYSGSLTTKPGHMLLRVYGTSWGATSLSYILNFSILWYLMTAKFMKSTSLKFALLRRMKWLLPVLVIDRAPLHSQGLFFIVSSQQARLLLAAVESSQNSRNDCSELGSQTLTLKPANLDEAQPVGLLPMCFLMRTTWSVRLLKQYLCEMVTNFVLMALLVVLPLPTLLRLT